MIKTDPTCAKCGGELFEEYDTRQGDTVYCRSCILDLAGQMITESDKREKEKKETVRQKRTTKNKSRIILKWSFLILVLGFLVYRIPYITATFHGEKPLRYGTYETNAAADECINRLWNISGGLQSKQTVSLDRYCPLSGKPYRWEEVGSRITVYCPNPRLHELMELKVSTGAPVPVVR